MRRTLTKIRNLVLHILFLVLLFIGSVLFFERMVNQTAPDTADAMTNTTFPLVYMVRSDVNFNCLHGYSREMDVSCLRDSVTPLTMDRTIDIRVQNFSSQVESISYEVLSTDGSESLENTQVSKITENGDELTATLTMQGKMLMNQEYVLKIALTTGGRTIYYYTNIVQMDGLHTDEYLEFVNGFYDKTVNRTSLTAVGTAVEPDETTDEDQTLAFMDIHDSVDQLTWGDLMPQLYYKPTPKITQINTTTASITLEYRIAAVNDDGITEVFNVDEYYRVRFTDSRVFLLNFERNTDEVFNPENNVLTDTGIRLGITGKTVNYKTDEKNRVTAFVQENELWTYERSTSKMTQVFSFPQKENMDIRDFYDAHDIHILRVTTEGDVLFVVSGYMNRGDHEGDNGILLYSYDADTDMVDELVFIQTSETGEMLERDLNALMYVTDSNSAFYFLLGEKLYRVTLSDRQSEVIAEGIMENCHASSESGRYFAYLPEGLQYGSEQMILLDLESGGSTQLDCAMDEHIHPVCFMNEDLVYGIARDSDIADATIDTGYFPMYRLVIADSEGTVLKDYQAENMCVTKVEKSDHMLSLTRVSRDASGAFTEASSDQIMDTSASNDVSTGVATKDGGRKQMEVYLRVGGTITDTTPDIVRSKIINYSTPRTVTIPADTERQELFYVYVSGKLKDAFVRVNEAIREADEGLGSVIDTQGRYIWVRGDKEVSADVRLEKVPAELTTGVTTPEALAEATDQTVLDLTGCTLDEVLYFVSHGTPVDAVTPDGPVTIVGYDEYNTHLLKPGENEWYYYGINDSTELFENAGNRFFTVLTE